MPAQFHKLNDGGSNPSPATKFIMDKKEYALNIEQLECINLAAETYKLYSNTFNNYTNEKRIELLQTGLEIVKDGLKIDEPTALIIQQVIHFRISLIQMTQTYMSENALKVIDEELNFIIKLILRKYEIENDSSNS